MNLEQIEARMAELDALVADTQDEEAVKNAIEERKQLEAEKAKLLAEEEEKKNQAAEAEKRAANAALLSGNPALGNVIENRKGATTMKDINEYRNSKEYIDAFAEYIKTGDDKQVRALLTTNVGEAGTIAVPSFVYDEIKTAWDRNEIFQFVVERSSLLMSTPFVSFLPSSAGDTNSTEPRSRLKAGRAPPDDWAPLLIRPSLLTKLTQASVYL